MSTGIDMKPWAKLDLLRIGSPLTSMRAERFGILCPSTRLRIRRAGCFRHGNLSHWCCQLRDRDANPAPLSDMLPMALSTLRRRLAWNGTSFQALKDELHRDLAMVRLNTSSVPLAALADELGFADSAASLWA